MLELEELRLAVRFRGKEGFRTAVADGRATASASHGICDAANHVLGASHEIIMHVLLLPWLHAFLANREF